MKLRKLAFLLVIVLGLTACGAQPELMPFIDAVPSEMDFEGMTFTIADSSSAGGTLLIPDMNSVPTVRMDALFDRYDEIEEKHNCEIEIISFESDTATLKYAVGDDYADLANVRLNCLIDHWKAGHVLPINEIGIDLSSGKFGSEQLLEALTWQGDTVGFFPMYWGIMTPNFCDAVYFNPKIFTNIAYPNPHELYEKGEWDWNALDEIGKACRASFTEDRPLYLSTLNNYFPRMMVLGNGGQYVQETATGDFEYGLLEDHVFAAVEKAHEFYQEGYLVEYPGSPQDALTLFVDGKLAIIAEYSVQGIFADKGVIGVDMQGEYGWIYNPKGPNGSDETVGVISNENQYIFVTHDKEMELTALAFFIETLLEPLGEEPMDWVDEFYMNNFYDEFSFEVFMNKFENTVFDKMIFAYTDDTVYNALLSAAKDGTIREDLEALATPFNARLNENLNK